VILEDSWDSDTQIVPYESFEYLKSENRHFAKKRQRSFWKYLENIQKEFMKYVGILVIVRAKVN
jgi:hypothetical protein